MGSAARDLSSQSIISPTTKPFDVPLTVAKFLEQQEKASTTTSVPQIQEENKKRLEARFDALTSELDIFLFEDESNGQPQTPSPPPASALFQSPPRISPIAPPTPADSDRRQPVSAYDRVSAPVVRVTKDVWNSLGKDMDLLKRQKRELEQQLLDLHKDHHVRLEEDHNVSAQLGKLKYQNEVSRDQKAEMGRSLVQRDVKIKEQELDILNLHQKLSKLEAEINEYGRFKGEAEYLRSVIKESDTARQRETKAQASTIRELELSVERLTEERDAVICAQVHAGDHATRANNLADVLAKREKVIMDLRQKTLEEQMRVTDLEGEVELLREMVNLENLNDIKAKLREKNSQCDRFRTQLKGSEHQLKLAQSRLMSSTDNGALLRGAAHIVAPNEKCRLPKAVMSCSECYAKNLPCDNGARCRNCVDNNTKCARWRCSMKHKLGVCERAPCAPPHDPEGWLVGAGPRPEW
jgi:outer membrane murein-binding lipoprotein Lpp